jgi:uncharacterized protein YjiS (DUF1127 family)
MAYAGTSTAGVLQVAAARGAIAMHEIRAALQRRRIYNETVRELGALSNRELADLGIHRSMITRIAIEASRDR